MEISIVEKRVAKREDILKSRGKDIVRVAIRGYLSRDFKNLLVEGVEILEMNEGYFIDKVLDNNLEELNNFEYIKEVFENLGYTVSTFRGKKERDMDTIYVHTGKYSEGILGEYAVYRKTRDITDSVTENIINSAKEEISKEFKDDFLRENGQGDWVDYRNGKNKKK